MNRKVSWKMFTGVLTCLVATASWAMPFDAFESTTLASHGAFGDTTLVPRDTTLFLHVERAGEWRRTLMGRPIEQWVRGVGEGGLDGTVREGGGLAAIQSWHKLARACGVDQSLLFDMLLGKSFSFAARGSEQLPLREWVLIIWPDSGPKSIDTLLMRLRPRLLGPRGWFRVMQLPEQNLMIAADTTRIVIAPATESALFDFTLNRMNSIDPVPGKAGPVPESQATLGDREDLPSPPPQKSRNGLLVYHGPPLDGWSCVVFDQPQGRQVAAQVTGRYEAPPFARTRTMTVWTPACIDRFEGMAMAVVGEPTDIGRTSFETFIEMGLQVPLFSKDLSRMLGPTRIFVVGEVEGRQEQPPVDLPLPSVALVLEVEGSDGLGDALDAHMTRLAAGIELLGEGTFDLPEPRWTTDAHGGLRRIDLQPAVAALADGWPLLRGFSLNWTTTTVAVPPDSHGGHDAGREPSSYCVVATHPTWLADTLRALHLGAETQPKQTSTPARWTSSGFIDGMRLGRQIDGLCSQPGLDSLAADDADKTILRRSLQQVAQLGQGIERFRWRLLRPSINELLAEIEITFAERESDPADGVGHP